MTSIACDYSNFSHTAYGKGYLVRPDAKFNFDDSHKYFHGGFWMPKKQGWFFKSEDFQKFQPLMKNHITKKEYFVQNTINEVHEGLQRIKSRKLHKPLTEFVYYPYGKGYLLYIHPTFFNQYLFPDDYKYFHGAWWMESQNAWFFKSELLEQIREKGAKLDNDYLLTQDEEETLEEYQGTYQSDDEMDQDDEDQYEDDDSDELEDQYDDEDQYEDEEFEEDEEEEEEQNNQIDPHGIREYVNYTEYGKGYLVKPFQTYVHYGKKYFHGGWWMPSQNGWFFKKDAFNKLRI